MNVLVIAPHADDEVLGCGGVIAKHVSLGDSVHVLVVTRGAPELYPQDVVENIRRELREAMNVLGVRSIKLMDFHAPKLDSIPNYAIAAAISKIVQELGPECVYIPHRGDIHEDHRAVHVAAAVACRPIHGCTVRRLLAYETLSETEWAEPSSSDAFIPTLFVDISEFLDLKLRAMACYKSQLRDFPNPRSLKSIEALARLRGSCVSVNACEAFVVLRQIDR